MAMDIETITDWLWVKNPCLIDFGQQGQGDLQYARIMLYDGNLQLTEGYYVAKDDVLVADISGYAEALFDLIPDDSVRNPQYCPAETCKNLSIRIYINNDDELIYNEIHTFIFGGKEPTDNFEIDEYAMTDPGNVKINFMTEFVRPKIFEGYPFELRFTKDGDTDQLQFSISITSFDKDGSQIENKNITLGSNGPGRNIIKVLPIEERNIGITLADHFIIGEGQYFINDIQCDYVKPEYPGGIYLRWINRIGGLDQYYFNLKDTKRPVKSTIVPLVQSLTFTDNWNHGIAKVVDKEKTTNYVIGATLIPVADYAVIARIAQSERVDMYLGSGKWIQVIVNDTDFNTAHENDYQDIEFQITTI